MVEVRKDRSPEHVPSPHARARFMLAGKFQDHRTLLGVERRPRLREFVAATRNEVAAPRD